MRVWLRKWATCEVAMKKRGNLDPKNGSSGQRKCEATERTLWGSPSELRSPRSGPWGGCRRPKRLRDDPGSENPKRSCPGRIFLDWGKMAWPWLWTQVSDADSNMWTVRTEWGHRQHLAAGWQGEEGTGVKSR